MEFANPAERDPLSLGCNDWTDPLEYPQAHHFILTKKIGDME
jgi:hypothetical protein